MEDMSRSTPRPSDEMDLSELLRRLIDYFRINGRIFLLTCGLSVVVAAVLYKLMPRTYAAHMVMESSVLNAHEQVEIVSNWDELLNKNGYPILARLFNCSPDLVASITSLKAEPVGTAPDPNSPFTLTMETGDSSKIKELQDHILYGLKNNDYARRRIAVRKENLEIAVAKAQQELDKLDSTAKFIQDFKGSGKTGGSQYLLDVSQIPEQRMSIMDKLLTYKEKLAFINDIQVLQEFLRPKRVRPVLPVFGLTGLLGGFIIGYLFILIRTARSLNNKK